MVEFDFDLSKKQYGLELDLRIIQKNYCCNCGHKLKRKTKVMVYLNKSKISKKFDYVYICPQTLYYCEKCNYYLSYKSQKHIRKQQKQLQSFILPNSQQYLKKYKLNKYLYKNFKH